jgi:hypothetical protein
MNRLLVTAIALSTAVIGSSQALTFPGGPRYDGIITVTHLTGASCSEVTFVGQKLNAVYRARTKPSQIAEAISLEVPLGALIIVAGGDGDFQGADQGATGSFIIDAWRQDLPDATLNLKFVPATINDAHGIKDTTDNFSFTGSVKNYVFPNCTIRVKATFAKR